MADAGDSTMLSVSDINSDNHHAAMLLVAKAKKAEQERDPDYHQATTPTKATTAKGGRQSVLDKLTQERNDVLDRWADAEGLGLVPDEAALNVYQKEHLKFLFGQTGFNPPVPARNPVSVSMHNPRFAAALWAVNTEAYRRKGKVSYNKSRTYSSNGQGERMVVCYLVRNTGGVLVQAAYGVGRRCNNRDYCPYELISLTRKLCRVHTVHTWIYYYCCCT